MNKKDELKSLSRLSALSALSDDELLVCLSNVLKDSRRVESVLVAHIAEVDARRLFAREASSSMHKYCTDVLNLSDAEAYVRITAARASRHYPVLLTMLEDGRLHLSGIAVLTPHLDKMNEANRDELLARATHKTKREILVLLAEIAPKPDVPPTIRKLPERRNQNEQQASQQRGADAANEDTTSSGETTAASGPSKPDPATGTAPDGLRPPGGDESRRSEAPPAYDGGAPETSHQRRAEVEPLSPGRFRIQFTGSAELKDQLDRLAELRPGSDLASMIEGAVAKEVERLEAERFGKTKKPRKSIEQADTSPGVRGISAPVRRFVWERDGGQCTYERSDGRRCPERRGVQFHHDDPYGLGGDRSATNVRLMCRQHNLYMGELDYGKEKMDRYRAKSPPADRVREPAPSLELRPERVVLPNSA